MQYETEVTVHFDDADPARVLFFGRLFSLAHRVVEGFVASLDVDWATWFSGSEFQVPIRYAEADYFRPMVPGQKYRAVLGIQRLGESSVCIQTQFFSGDGEEPCARVKTTHVFTDTRIVKRLQIPTWIREKLSPYCLDECP